jgi:hypothetical protein
MHSPRTQRYSHDSSSRNSAGDDQPAPRTGLSWSLHEHAYAQCCAVPAAAMHACRNTPLHTPKLSGSCASWLSCKVSVCSCDRPSSAPGSSCCRLLPSSPSCTSPETWPRHAGSTVSWLWPSSRLVSPASGSSGGSRLSSRPRYSTAGLLRPQCAISVVNVLN